LTTYILHIHSSGSVDTFKSRLKSHLSFLLIMPSHPYASASDSIINYWHYSMLLVDWWNVLPFYPRYISYVYMKM